MSRMNVESTSNGFLKTAVISAGAGSTALGLLVLMGWYTHNVTLIQVHPAFVPMQYNTALGFLLCGTGLISIISGRLRLGMAFGGIAAAIGILTLTEYIFGVNLGIDQLFMESYISVKTSHPGRMAPNTALNFTLTGFALLVMCGVYRRRYRATISSLLSWGTLTLGTVALFGYLIDVEAVYGWGRLTRMAVHTAAGFIFLSIGIIGLIWGEMRKEETAWTRWLPLLVGIGGVIFTVIIWQALLIQESVQIKQTIQLGAANIKKEIQEGVEFQILALIRMAKRWEVQGGTFKKNWESDAGFYVKHHAGYQAIGWVDSSFHVRWIAPLKGNEVAMNLNLVFEERRRAALEAARDKRTISVSRSIDLVQGGKGFLIFVPIFKGEEFDGFILGVFRSENFFQSVLGEIISRRFLVAIYDGKKEIYKGYIASRWNEKEWSQETEVNVRGVVWRIQIWPTSKLMAASRSYLPLTVLMAGTLTASLLGVVILFMRIAGFREKEAKAACRELEKEATARKRIEEEREKVHRAMGERVKELQCIYGVASSIRDHATLEEIFRETVDFIPPGWQYSEITRAKICLDGKEYVSEPFEETEWKQSSDIKVNGERRGSVEVFYLEERPELDEGPFLSEERRLINGIAHSLSEAIQRKQTEEAIEESEERFREHFDSAPICIFEEDFSVSPPRITRANRRAEEVYGWSAEEFLTLPVERLVTENATSDFEELTLAVERGERIVFESLNIRKGGSEFPVRISVSTSPTAGSERVIVTIEDITERKRIEEELERLVEELKSKNAELERFTYTVSHDLKSPLVTIRGFLGQIQAQVSSGNMENMEGDFARIDRAAGTMQKMLDELLELSRIGRLVNPPEEMPFGELAREAAELVVGQAADGEVRVEISPDLPAVFGDRRRLLEVVQNLIENAVKFMGDQPEPRIEIGSRQEGEETVFYVRDNGMGVAPRHHERIFGLFNRLNIKIEGTGIGLAIAKRIVEVHGGRIWVESEGPGRGSTLSFALPSKKGGSP